MKKVLLVPVIACLCACTAEDPRSVAWFTENEVEREALLAQCGNNAIPESMECMNAQKAKDSIALKRRGYVKPAAVDFGNED